MGLDDDQSRIITSEVNGFTWKGPDVRRTPAGKFSYGHLPPGLTKATIELVRDNARNRDLSVVDRDDEYLSQRVRNFRKEMQQGKEPDKDRER